MTKRPSMVSNNPLASRLAPKATDAPASPPPAPSRADDIIPRSTRQKGRGILVRINDEAWRELRLLALDQQTTLNQVMLDAINDKLRKHGKPAIAENPLL